MAASSEELFSVVAERLLQRSDDLVARQLCAVRAFGSYDRVPEEDLLRSCRRNIARVVGMLTYRDRLPPEIEEDELVTGQRRALQGVPPEDVVAVYRAVLSVLRDAFIEEAAAIDAHAALLGTRRLWELTDKFSSVLVSARHQVDLDAARRDERQRMAFLQHVLTGNVAAAELVHGGAVYGLVPDSDYWVFRARQHAGDSQRLSRHIEHSTATTHFMALLGPFDGDLAGISAKRPATVDFGVIATAGPTPLSGVGHAFAEATRVLNVALRYRRRGLVDSSSLSVRIAVAQEDELGEALFQRYVQRLQSHGTMPDVLLQSIRVYLRERRLVAAAARALSIHVNTLRYRLERYESITGADLTDTDSLVEVWWALEYARIRHRAPGASS